jgi:hypothetical protein
MNGGASQPVLRPAFAHRLDRARTFRAWRVPETGRAIEIDTGNAATMDEAKNAALSSCALQHKETLLVHERDAARRTGVLNSYYIKQESRAQYRRDPLTGVSKAERRLYEELQFSVPVDAFEPTRPFDAFRDDAVGVDRTLLDARGGGR